MVFFLVVLFAGTPAFSQGTDDYDTTVVTTETASQYISDTSYEPPVAVRPIADSTMRRIKGDEAYWYANVEPEKEKKKPEENTQGSSIFDNKTFRRVIWILVILVFIGALVWYLSSINVKMFRKKVKVLNRDEEEMPLEDIFSLDYEQSIAKAVSKGDYRMAIRLNYLSTLKELSTRRLINYTDEKTNSSYLSELAGTKYYRPFFRLTRGFEYSWYGQLPIAPDIFSRVQEEFNDFKKGLPA